MLLMTGFVVLDHIYRQHSTALYIQIIAEMKGWHLIIFNINIDRLTQSMNLFD